MGTAKGSLENCFGRPAISKHLSLKGIVMTTVNNMIAGPAATCTARELEGGRLNSALRIRIEERRGHFELRRASVGKLLLPVKGEFVDLVAHGRLTAALRYHIRERLNQLEFLEGSIDEISLVATEACDFLLEGSRLDAADCELIEETVSWLELSKSYLEVLLFKIQEALTDLLVGIWLCAVGDTVESAVVSSDVAFEQFEEASDEIPDVMEAA
ncbi:hypothetical protein [Rhizobium sp. RAF56]|uniref:hypothetical protein n=1 Tax=Rhizobium sp. RAF56 TaxID=3233062 RepID=UPI003F9E2025